MLSFFKTIYEASFNNLKYDFPSMHLNLLKIPTAMRDTSAGVFIQISHCDMVIYVHLPFKRNLKLSVLACAQ